MESAAHRVAIVVDRSFGARLLNLRDVDHVWVVESAANSPVVRALWSREVARTGTPVEMTLFKSAEDASPQAVCVNIADTVDEHHGESAQAGPWTEIAVIGTALTPQLNRQFSQLGAGGFIESEEGFRCLRAPAT